MSEKENGTGEAAPARAAGTNAYVGEGIIVEATVDCLRRAADAVLVQYTEWWSCGGPPTTGDQDIDPGTTLVFKEQMETCPAEIVCVRLSDDAFWYVLSTSECPPEKCTPRMAIRCAQAEEKRLERIRSLLEETEGASVLGSPDTWVPDEQVDARRAIRFMRDAFSRFAH